MSPDGQAARAARSAFYIVKSKAGAAAALEAVTRDNAVIRLTS
jgi:hypothetical protein